MNAVETVKLKKSYTRNKPALCETNISISQGEIFGFLGPNGSGKTTTIRLLNGILQASGGTAFIMGMDVAKNQSEIHKLCGVMTETALMYENLTAIENLTLFGRLHGMSDNDIKNRSRYLLGCLELIEAKNKKLKVYSTGMKRRISLARALLHSPKILFLDEPTSGLDPEAAINVTNMIQKLSHEQGVTVFLCSHQLKYAEEICTLYGFIHEGKIIGNGTFDELLKQKKCQMFIEIRGENLPNIKCSELTKDGKMLIPIQSDKDVTKIMYEIMSSGGQIFEAKQVTWNLEDLYFSFQKEV